MKSAPRPKARDEGGRSGIVILEPEARGHAREWLQHVLDFLATSQTTDCIWLVVPEALCRALDQTLPPALAGRVHLVPMSPADHRRCTDSRLVVSAFTRWRVMHRHLRITGARSGFFMALDHLSLPLALGFGSVDRPIAGILFRPSVHYNELVLQRRSWHEWLRDFRKDLLYRLMLRNRALTSVLSLDPFFSGYAQRRYRHGSKVRTLPDPVHPAPEELAGTGRSGPLLPADRVIFLLFGHLTERKGPLVLLEALFLLEARVAARVAILFAGGVDPAIRDRLSLGCRRLRAERPDIWVQVDDRHLPATELDVLVRRSDVILAPYQRFVGSSGVLLWAARTERPVLAQDYGLVGELTRRHRLGLTTDSADAAAIARDMTRMVEEGPDTFIDRPTARAFAADRTPRDFASIILTSVSRTAAQASGRTPRATLAT